MQMSWKSSDAPHRSAVWVSRKNGLLSARFVALPLFLLAQNTHIIQNSNNHLAASPKRGASNEVIPGSKVSSTFK
jgi:hypothetical protein